MHRHRHEHDAAEREPLDDPNDQRQHYHNQSRSRNPGPYYDDQPQQPQQYGRPRTDYPHQHQYRQEPYSSSAVNSSPPRAARGARRPGPGSHPDSSYNRIREERRLSREQPQLGGFQAPYQPPTANRVVLPVLDTSPVPTNTSTPPQPNLVSPISSPDPACENDRHWGRGDREMDYRRPPAAMQPHLQNTVTPNSDNFSDSAAGGMAGIAYSVAERNARESGLDAIQNANSHRQQYLEQGYRTDQWHQQQQQQQQQQVNGWEDDARYNQPPPPSQQQPPLLQQQGPHLSAYPNRNGDRNSHSSLTGLGAAAVPPGNASPGVRTPSRSPQGPYTDNPYPGYSRTNQGALGVVNPLEIDDDGDDGLEYGSRRHRTSMLSLGGTSNRSGSNHNGAAALAGVGATAGAVGGSLTAGRAAAGAKNGAYGYGPVSDGGSGTGSGYHDAHNLGGEKPSYFPGKQGGKSKKWRWVMIVAIILVVIAAIVLGILFGIVFKNNAGSNSQGAAGGGGGGQSASEDQAQNGDLNADSGEIKQLMNNPNLHKVFMGMDYTPLNTQYPECIHTPPSQNNITRDVAVLSRLTNVIRLYGTDCNQTQMVVHAIRQLKLTNSVKVWLGVWHDKNTTTNERQLRQMWNILDEYGPTPFKGLIIANEILFRKEMTIYQLSTLMNEVRTNLSRKGYTGLPVATSDLGRDWTAELGQASELIMANIHPFFTGQPSTVAASWSVSFWENMKSVWKSDKSKNIIAEIGWPSQGGKHCGNGEDASCSPGAVAGVDGMNKLMEDWICPALNNGTNYFWFSAFDEPWKMKFNSDNQKWEDHWGLMDVNRNLKSGVKIPDCGGKTVDGASV